MTIKSSTAIFGGGCFWCTEAVFSRLKGVLSVTPGYAGGTVAYPSYDLVCTGTTGHAEVVKIDFDPHQISYQQLLAVFFSVHDPTTLNQQGADMGTQYRSLILYTDNLQHQQITGFIHTLTTNHTFSQPIVTDVKPFSTFYPAEISHREYYARHAEAPYCQLVINPKLDKLKSHYANLLK